MSHATAASDACADGRSDRSGRGWRWVRSRDYVGRPWHNGCDARDCGASVVIAGRRRDGIMGRGGGVYWLRATSAVTRARHRPKVGEESEAVRLIPPRRESETAAACASRSGQSAYTTGGSGGFGGFGGGGCSRFVVIVNVRILHYYYLLLPCRIVCLYIINTTII